MKKAIAIALSLITIVICGWLIVNRMDMLDIPSNKNDWYASDAKWKISKRTDIPDSEKRILQDQIDLKRKNERLISNIASQTIIIAFSIIVIQLILLVFIILITKRQDKIIADENLEK